jgi:hypothetical protein
MKKYLYLILLVVMLLFVVAADFIGEIPEWLIMLLTVVIMPGAVGLAKAGAAKWPKELGWLDGKFWLSILTYLIAIAVVAAFTTWGELLKLPQDPALAAPFLVLLVQAFFGAATGLYNVLIAPVHKRLSG